MFDDSYPATLVEYLAGQLQELSARSRLVIALDPAGRLNVGDEFVAPPRTWRVIRYTGNDLAFRATMPDSMTDDSPVMVLVSRSRYPAQAGPIELSSITDVLRRADEIIDLSLVGVLTALIPNETWPEVSLDRYGDIISERLDDFGRAFAALRPHLNRRAPLDLHAIRALVLYCVEPSQQPVAYLFNVDSPAKALLHYAMLSWSADWDAAAHEILRQQARDASRLDLSAYVGWFEADLSSLARFIYWYRFLSRARVPNLANQLRGLGVLGFDPEMLEPGAGIVLTLWDRDKKWRGRVIRQAEAGMELTDIRRAVGLLNLPTIADIAELMSRAEASGLVYYLGTLLLETGIAGNQMSEAFQAWSQNRPAILGFLEDIDSVYGPQALTLASVLDESASISLRITSKLDPPPDVGGILDWYVAKGLYDIEFAYARAFGATQRLSDEGLRAVAVQYLYQLRKQLRNYLDQADHELARRITPNWNAFLNSERLSTRVLRDFATNRRLKPTREACLWFIVFDGMRYDTWQRVVKPRLQQKFVVKKERAYLSILPSWTRIARTSLVAGNAPANWKRPRPSHSFTFEQGALLASLFDLTDTEYKQKVRFYSQMESDRTTMGFDRAERRNVSMIVRQVGQEFRQYLLWPRPPVAGPAWAD